MTSTTLHATPRPRDVLLEQVRAVGLALRLPAILAVVVAASVMLLVAMKLIDTDGPVDFHPELSMLPGWAGLLLPIGVWKGEERFGAGFLWTLPVDRRAHALAKVFAGWGWLMAAVLLFWLWVLALTLITHGNITGVETLRVVPASLLDAPGAIAPAAVRTVRWTPPPVLWLVPFTAASGAYLLASALALGVRHPLRWIVGTVLTFFLLGLSTLASSDQWLRLAPSRALQAFLRGPYGLDTLFTARTESLHTVALLATGETIGVWQELPDVGRWATTTLLWIGVGLLALWAAAWRHRERRRA